MYGFMGKILRINLKEKTIKKEALNKQWGKEYIGGRGLAEKYLVEVIDPKIDALSPDNKLIFVTGPLTGTPAPTGGRYMVVTKSPLTGAIACSNAGGRWGAELKMAGYDMIIIEEESPVPVYINIKDDEVTIEDAIHLWGMLTSEVTSTLIDEIGDPNTKVATIGPAGEKLSRLASIMNDLDYSAGRSGVGAVMGSKNLKAITVRGTGKSKVANPVKFKEVAAGCNKKIKDNKITGLGLPTYGSAVLVNIINENGILPTNNYQSSSFPMAEAISGEVLAEQYLVKRVGCYSCPIACGRHCRVEELEVGGPKYETIWGFGANCGVPDLGAIIKANHWCNELGLDTISTSATIAAAMELSEKGYIHEDDVAGLPLKFGNTDAIIEWTIRIGLREGFADLMAEGSYRLCEILGVPQVSMSVKKQEIPAYDPRGTQGQGLAFATSNRGGCHVSAHLISLEILGLPEKLDRFSLEGKAEWVKALQDLTAVIDSSGLCLNTSLALGAEDYVELYNAVCGTEHTVESLLEAGERIWNLEKLFNLEAGFSIVDDTLPKRLLEEEILEGISKGNVVKLGEVLPTYFDLRGWDQDGVPTEEQLKKLGIKLPCYSH